MQSFRLFGSQHLAALAVVAGMSAFTALAARRGTEPQRRWIGRAVALLVIALVAETYVRRALARPLHVAYDLPIEICDVVLVFCAVMCVARHVASFELAYFWGLAGTLQALITPDLEHGFPSSSFVEFSGGMAPSWWPWPTAILCGLRPRPGGPMRALFALNGYVLVVGALDWAFGWNYGYLCHRPVGASLLSLLGPWPWYLVAPEGVAAASFFLLDLPWRLRRR